MQEESKTSESSLTRRRFCSILSSFSAMVIDRFRFRYRRSPMLCVAHGKKAMRWDLVAVGSKKAWSGQKYVLTMNSI